jgi:hypothetical protein
MQCEYNKKPKSPARFLLIVACGKMFQGEEEEEYLRKEFLLYSIIKADVTIELK